MKIPQYVIRRPVCTLDILVILMYTHTSRVPALSDGKMTTGRPLLPVTGETYTYSIPPADEKPDTCDNST